ncbi:hypothetical protein NL529_32195, partial [Klebsiella pneumoniae]|nr:hypothetical protein [Klebsiella pneumoniae]
MTVIGSLASTLTNAPLSVNVNNNLTLAGTGASANTIDLVTDTTNAGTLAAAAGAQWNVTSTSGYNLFTQAGPVT